MKTRSSIDNYYIEGLLESEGALLPPQAERQAGGQGPRGGRGEGSGRVPVAVHQVVHSTIHTVYSTLHQGDRVPRPGRGGHRGEGAGGDLPDVPPPRLGSR